MRTTFSFSLSPWPQGSTDVPRPGVEAQLVRQLTEKASDGPAFRRFMGRVFGPEADSERVERLRQRVLHGDFSWLPKVQYVDGASLNGAYGAYDAKGRRILLDRALLDDPKKAQRVFVEEAGHHIDTIVNDKDAAGDEGAIFRRLLAGEDMSATALDALRAEDDRAVIVVDGRQVEVEQWNPFSAVSSAVKKVGRAIGSGARRVARGVRRGVRRVARAVGRAAKGVGEGVVSLATGVGRAVKDVVFGIGEGATGFVRNLVRGKIADAFSAAWRGVDRTFLKSSKRLLTGFFNGLEHAGVGLSALLGPLEGLASSVAKRVVDWGRNNVVGIHNAFTGVVRNWAEGAGRVALGLGDIVRGRLRDGFASIGGGLFGAFVQAPIDGLIHASAHAASGLQTLVGLEPAGRALTAEERDYLEAIYGDSLDYDAVRIKEGHAGLYNTNPRPFALGDVIYLKARAPEPSLVAHEAAHVWQHQNGGNDYISEAVWSQHFGRGYDWASSVPDTPWAGLEPEQQAQLLQDALTAGYFDSGRFLWDANRDGRREDYTAYLEEALRVLRKGFGAP